MHHKAVGEAPTNQKQQANTFWPDRLEPLYTGRTGALIHCRISSSHCREALPMLGRSHPELPYSPRNSIPRQKPRGSEAGTQTLESVAHTNPRECNTPSVHQLTDKQMKRIKSAHRSPMRPQKGIKCPIICYNAEGLENKALSERRQEEPGSHDFSCPEFSEKANPPG